MTACTCIEPPRRLLLDLSPDLSYAFGLAIIDLEFEDVEAATQQPGAGDRLDETIYRWQLATIRFVQCLGSVFLNIHGLRLVKAAVDLLAHAGDESVASRDALTRFIVQATAVSDRGAYGLSAFDLLESAATLEAHRHYVDRYVIAGEATPVNLYLDLMKTMHPDAAAPQRHGFSWLSNRLGPDDAYLLLAPLTFLALISDDPVETFMRLAGEAIGVTERLRMSSAEELTAWAGIGDRYVDEYLLPIASGEPIGTTFITDPLRAALQIWGVAPLLEAFCRPSVHLSALPGDQATFRHLLPPLQLLRNRSGELVMLSNGLAATQPDLSYDILRHAGIVAAAERLTLRAAGVEHACWHENCPVFATGLCSRWYYIPSAEEGHDACLFPREFEAVANLSPVEAWSAQRNRA